jgi:D-lactate dehydrogenase
MNEHIIYFDCIDGSNPDPSLAAAGYQATSLMIHAQDCPPELAAEATVITLHTSSKLDRDAINKFPKLKLIVARSTGFDHIDIAAANQRNIPVCTVPSYGANTVAEYTFLLILALSRRILPIIEATRCGEIDPIALQGSDLSGKTLGVIGAGMIGKHTITIGNGFGMKVVAFDPYPNEAAAKDLNFTYVTLEELLAQSDVVSLHAPATPENMHLMNHERFEMLKPGAILINTARGSLIDTEALIDALSTGKIGGVGIDVIEGEALIDADTELHMLESHSIAINAEHAAQIGLLSRLPNVILTAHNAYNSREALSRIQSVTVEDILGFFNGAIVNEVKLKVAS